MIAPDLHPKSDCDLALNRSVLPQDHRGPRRLNSWSYAAEELKKGSIPPSGAATMI